MMNSAVYAMQVFQSKMAGEAEKSGLESEEAVNDFINELRMEN